MLPKRRPSSPGSSAGTPTRPSSSMSAPLELSLVVPVYNERDNLPILVEEIGRALAGRGEEGRYEIVAVEDGATDGSLYVLNALERDHTEIPIVAFGEEAGAAR